MTGVAGPCVSSPSGRRTITDSIEARFAHPDVDADQRLYSLLVFREYPDVVYAQPLACGRPFDEVRKALFRTYGKPISEVRRERVASASPTASEPRAWRATSARGLPGPLSLGGRGHSARAPSTKTPPAIARARYVKAAIEISRSPSTKPPNAFYVLSLKLLVEDPDLRAPDAWNARL